MHIITCIKIQSRRQRCGLTGKVVRWKLYMQDWNFTVPWVEGQEVHQQVPDKLSRLVSNPEEIKTSNDTDTATLSVAVAQVDISDAEYDIISSQHNATRGHSIARRRLYLPKSRIESTNIHSKMPSLSTDESDQTVSQSKTIHNDSVVPLPSHLCGPHWPTSDRRGRIPAYAGSDLCVLTLDRTFSN